ncbi:MAG: hypothetical protein J6Q13_00445 [Clostridia bacterium]|nr:hypothetical protein [Clostridia bacterium]
MKKFFGKKPVMITFIALAVIFAVVYIGMLVRPVAIGMTYKGTMEAYGDKVQLEVKVKNGSKVNVKMSQDGASMEFEDMRYIEHDREIYVFFDADEMTDEQFEDAKKLYIEHWDEIPDDDPFLLDVNAFSISNEGSSLKCTGSVVFAVIGGIVELVLLAGAGLSVFYKVKK